MSFSQQEADLIKEADLLRTQVEELSRQLNDAKFALRWVHRYIAGTKPDTAQAILQIEDFFKNNP